MRASASAITVSVLTLLGTALVLSALPSTASAAGVGGTWESRIPGEGYVQYYIGPYGEMVTDKFDVKLTLTESDEQVTGTLESWGSAGYQVHNVWGYVSGSVFYMTVDFGWDGVNYLTPTFPLTIDGNTMLGSGSYVNVGVTITGTFDVEKTSTGVFVDLGLEFLVEYNNYITLVVIVVAIGAMAVGSVPVVPKALVRNSRLEPSKTGETNWQTPGPPTDLGRPVGGIGLHDPGASSMVGPSASGPYMVRRPMSSSERDLSVRSASQMRSVVQGIGFASIIVAGVSLTWPNGLLSLITISVAFTALVVAGQYLRSRARLKATLVHDTVVDLRGVAQKTSSPKGWRVGPVTLGSMPQVNSRLMEGRPVTLTCSPEAKLLLAIDGISIGNPVSVSAPESIWTAASSPIVSVPSDDELPPPPSD